MLSSMLQVLRTCHQQKHAAGHEVSIGADLAFCFDGIGLLAGH